MSTTTLLSSRHPEFEDVEPDYILMDDGFRGERVVKNKTFDYLPPTDGQVLDGARQNVNTIGYGHYLGYLARAVYPEYIERAVGTLVGVLNREDPKIDLPPAMEPMRENATRRGESLTMLYRRINSHQLLFGRLALLADALEGRPTPILVDYTAQALINWDDEPFDTLDPFMLRFAILDESRPQLRDGLFWEEIPRARALLLGSDFAAIFGEISNPEAGRVASDARTYRTFVEDQDLRGPPMEPRLAGRALPFIPLTVIGSTDLALTPGTIPLLGLGNLCLSIYRGEADHRHNLHLQGQDTLVIVGQEGSAEDPDAAASDQTVRIGAGARIEVPIGGDAKFIGVNPGGLAEQRSSIEADRRAAQDIGSRLLNPQGAAAESGEALRIRIAASTATLTLVAKTAAFGLQTSLRQCATWMNLDPSQVVVTPNLNFAEVRPETRAVGDLMDAKAKGAPISLRTVHRYAQDGDITKMTFDEEMTAIEDEEPLVEAPVEPDIATPAVPAEEPVSEE